MYNADCPICDGPSRMSHTKWINYTFYECTTCGRFEINSAYLQNGDSDIFAPFLYYNPPDLSDSKGFYFIGGQKAFDTAQTEYPWARLLTKQITEEWYPKNFNEKINLILLKTAQLSDYAGSKVHLSNKQVESMFFVKRYSEHGKKISIESLDEQICFISDYMAEQKLIDVSNNTAVILPEGLKRIDELQKNQSSSKQVFVAMSFDPDTKDIREAIRKGIEQAGYVPCFMDEVQHNKQIVPEMLYQIRKSRFVVADLTSHNNGAYYEAGYAAGLGKEVIHICRRDTLKRKGHFDVKQQATILWDKSEEIIEALHKRIKATII
jgi:nucleoside 2-deoxyribosyltransferase